MKIDINAILKDPGASLPFAVNAELADLAEGLGTIIFHGPVTAAGTVQNLNGMLRVNGSAGVDYETLCDRCGVIVTGRIQVELREDLIEVGKQDAEEPGDDRFSFSGHEIDLEPILRDNLLVEAPLYAVCSEDCEGICPDCGQVRQDGRCNCSGDMRVDPRLEALKAFLQQNDD